MDSIVQLPLDFNPPKLCECGCGQPAPIARQTDRHAGHIKGQPMRFIIYHAVRRFQTVEERFWSKVDKSGGPDACWLWTDNRGRRGYGTMTVQGKARKAHRIAWEIANGKALCSTPPDVIIRHSCDNPPCCNPAHLQAGTQQDNVTDREIRGRARHHAGEAHHAHKLTWDVVRDIRRRHHAGEAVKDLAKYAGVGEDNIRRILRFDTWRE